MPNIETVEVWKVFQELSNMENLRINSYNVFINKVSEKQLTDLKKFVSWVQNTLERKITGLVEL